MSLNLSVCNPSDHAGCWGSTPVPSPRALSLAVRPLVAGPWARVSLFTRVALPHCWRDIPGRHDPVTGLRRDPLGSSAVHAGPCPSSYTTHNRQAPSDVRRWGGAPARWQVSSLGRSLRPDRELTNPLRCGSSGTPGPQLVALTQPKSQAGPAVARSHAGSGPPWW